MNDLLRKNNDQPTNNIDVSCVQTVGLKHAKGNSNLEYCDICNKPFRLFRLSAKVCGDCADIRILFSESITTPVLLCREWLYNFQRDFCLIRSKLLYI
jgi:hypothetical protein